MTRRRGKLVVATSPAVDQRSADVSASPPQPWAEPAAPDGPVRWAPASGEARSPSPSPRRARGAVTVVRDRCKECSFCIEMCPHGVLETSGELNSRGYRPPRVKCDAACVNCDTCTIVCPEFAIFSTRTGPGAAELGETRYGESHPIDPLLRTRLIPHILCPGCGIGIVVQAFLHAIASSDRFLEKHAVVTGIGCTARVGGFMNLDTYHTTHGRPIAFATGLKLARPDMAVTVISGDGDLFAIGGNHFLHAARRNLDIKVICVNNFNYGMTGGQVGPTTPVGAVTTTSPVGNPEYPLNLPRFAAACGATYVARWTTYHVRQLRWAMEEMFARKGFSFLEVVSPCPTSYGGPNKIGSGYEEMLYYKENSVVRHWANLDEIDIQLREPIVVGKFVQRQRETFEEALERRRAQVPFAGIGATVIPR